MVGAPLYRTRSTRLNTYWSLVGPGSPPLTSRRARFSFKLSPSQKYDQAAEVRRKIKLLGDCMHEHFQVVRTHVAAQVESKIAETGK